MLRTAERRGHDAFGGRLVYMAFVVVMLWLVLGWRSMMFAGLAVVMVAFAESGGQQRRVDARRPAIHEMATQIGRDNQQSGSNKAGDPQNAGRRALPQPPPR